MDYYLRFSAEELEKIAADCRNTLEVLTYSNDAPSKRIKSVSRSILGRIAGLKIPPKTDKSRLGNGTEEYEGTDKNDLIS